VALSLEFNLVQDAEQLMRRALPGELGQDALPW
jgi:hypothetical protein